MDLLIVESGAKSKTIQKYLGKEWMVVACGGHVQDLPRSKKTKDGKKAMWPFTEDKLPSPPWEWTERGEGVITKLIKRSKDKNVDKVYIATDPDREGEFIAWRLEEIFTKEGYSNIQRVTFNEITKTAVQAAIAAGGSVNTELVSAAKVRRFMDRLVGFRSSKFSRSWSLPSMGRVQTPTLGFVVDRELEREAFVPQPYYAVHAEAGGVRWNAKFHSKGDAEAWFDDKNKFHADRTNDANLAQAAFDSVLAASGLTIESAEPGKFQRNPSPPFTTDALLMKAGSEMSWSPKRTMAVAGELYNAGHITYIRTDSTRTNPSAREDIKAYIRENWGENHLGKGVVGSDAKKGAANVQDAHEAIRPTNVATKKPEGLSSDQNRLYNLVWAQFAASQMSASNYERLSMKAVADGFSQHYSGTSSWRVHRGWEAAFEGIRKEPATKPPAFDTSSGTLIALDELEDDDATNPCLREDETQPPSRYRQHSLVKKMKSEGIGRPSTYATTIDRLLTKKYVSDENGSLVPTEGGRTLWVTVAPHYTPKGEKESLFATAFTAEMEASLDEIESGEIIAASVWSSFAEKFQDLHNVALERKKRKPTPKQAAYFVRITDGLTPEEINGFTEGKDPETMTGDEMRLVLDALTKARPKDTLPASEKQVSWIASLADDCKFSEEEACAKVELKAFSELTGGRTGSASKLIGILKELTKDIPRPPSEKQLKYIQSLSKTAEMSIEDVCKLVSVDSLDKLSGSQGGTASQLITILQKKTGGKRSRRRGKKRSGTKAVNKSAEPTDKTEDDDETASDNS